MPRSAIVSRIAHEECLDAPVHRPGSRWWAELPLDFAKRPEQFRLELRDSLQVRAAATWDLAVRTGSACLVSALAFPFGYHPGAVRRALADRDFYGTMAESGDPDLFFSKPPRGTPVDVRDARRPLFRPSDGTCLDLRWRSSYVPRSARERPHYLRHRRNRFAHARLWRHHRGPRPTIIAVHGFGADLYHVNEWFFALPWMYKLGFDVALFTLPFHGPRQTRFSPFSGHGFFAGGPARINESFGQAIYDLRTLMDHLLEAQGVPRVGVTGVSLGGFTSALLAAVDDRIAFSIPNVPIVSLPDLLLEWQPLGMLVQGSLAAFRRSLVDARYMLAVSSPLTYMPRLPRERLMVIGGVADRLAPPKHARLLWEHWGRCRLHWFPGNHIMHFDRGAYLREIARFLHAIGFFEGLPALSTRSRERRPALPWHAG